MHGRKNIKFVSTYHILDSITKSMFIISKYAEGPSLKRSSALCYNKAQITQIILIIDSLVEVWFHLILTFGSNSTLTVRSTPHAHYPP